MIELCRYGVKVLAMRPKDRLPRSGMFVNARYSMGFVYAEDLREEDAVYQKRPASVLTGPAVGGVVSEGWYTLEEILKTGGKVFISPVCKRVNVDEESLDRLDEAAVAQVRSLKEGEMVLACMPGKALEEYSRRRGFS